MPSGATSGQRIWRMSTCHGCPSSEHPDLVHPSTLVHPPCIVQLCVRESAALDVVMVSCNGSCACPTMCAMWITHSNTC